MVLCVFLACHNLSQLSETYKKLKPSNSFSKCGNLGQMPIYVYNNFWYTSEEIMLQFWEFTGQLWCELINETWKSITTLNILDSGIWKSEFRSYFVVCGRKHVNKYLDRLTPNFVKTVCLNLNLNSLLVKRQTDNTSPGGALGGKLVPGSHKRCEFGAWCLGWDFKFNCVHSCALFFYLF